MGLRNSLELLLPRDQLARLDAKSSSQLTERTERCPLLVVLKPVDGHVPDSSRIGEVSQRKESALAEFA